MSLHVHSEYSSLENCRYLRAIIDKMRRQIPKVCDHCGQTFKSGAGLALHLRWLDKPRVPKVTLTCSRLGCTKTFLETPGRTKYRKYCSKACLAKDRPRDPMTDEQKEIISQAQKDRFAKDPTSNPFYGRTPTNYQGWGHGQFVECLGFWVRSTWERDYLLALKAANVEFEYEAVRFDLDGKGTYCPDIRLGNRDIYVEITGWDKPGKAEKRRLFQDIYGHPLYVIDQRPTKGHIAEFVALCKEVIRDDVTPCS